jgi:hypothetical protein
MNDKELQNDKNQATKLLQRKEGENFSVLSNIAFNQGGLMS